MYIAVDLQADNSERVHYNSPDMPVYARKGRLSYYQNMAAVSHWHDDLEFLVVLAGHMAYNINGNLYTLSCGNGIFVNSQQLHYGYSADDTDCEFICVLLHPMLLCANPYLEQTYITPVITNNAFPGQILSQNVLWEKEITDDISRIFQYCTQREKITDLMVQCLYYHIWALLYEHMPKTDDTFMWFSHQLSSLRDMIGFIQKRYSEKMTVSDIASSGKVCQSNCFLFFNKFLHQTPLNYLMNYRLDKSLEMLNKSNRNIADIAFTVGFSGASYYTETFRKHFGCTPKEYRKQTAKRDTFDMR